MGGIKLYDPLRISLQSNTLRFRCLHGLERSAPLNSQTSVSAKPVPGTATTRRMYINVYTNNTAINNVTACNATQRTNKHGISGTVTLEVGQRKDIYHWRLGVKHM